MIHWRAFGGQPRRAVFHDARPDGLAKTHAQAWLAAGAIETFLATRSPIQHYAIAQREACDAVPHGFHEARPFVPERHGHGVRRRACANLPVTPAYASRSHLYENLSRPGRLEVKQLDLDRPTRLAYNSVARLHGAGKERPGR